MGKTEPGNEARVCRRLQARLRARAALLAAADALGLRLHLAPGWPHEKPSGRQSLGSRDEADGGRHALARHVLPDAPRGHRPTQRLQRLLHLAPADGAVRRSRRHQGSQVPGLHSRRLLHADLRLGHREAGTLLQIQPQTQKSLGPLTLKPISRLQDC